MLRKLKEWVKLVKTRNVRKYWETAYDMIIIRSIKDVSKWDILMSEAYEKFLEFKKLYQLYEDPPNSGETWYDFATIKEISEIRVDLVDAEAEDM